MVKTEVRVTFLDGTVGNRVFNGLDPEDLKSGRVYPLRIFGDGFKTVSVRPYYRRKIGEGRTIIYCEEDDNGSND